MRTKEIHCLRLVLMAAVAATMSAASAADAAPVSAPSVNSSDPDAMRAAAIMRAGGHVEKQGVSKGLIAFIDTQDMIGKDDVVAAVGMLDMAIRRYNVLVATKAPAAPEELKKQAGADIAVIIVDNETSPALLAAPEDHWAQVNVHKMLANLKTDDARKRFFASRCRKEIVRAFACACGGIGSSFPGNLMNVAKVEDLDLCDEFVPVDKFDVFKRHLKDAGLTPRFITTYRRACREGWAPAPTNDVQKAIWEKVRSDKERGPTNPITIPPPKK